jgi:hypothetical protein
LRDALQDAVDLALVVNLRGANNPTTMQTLACP